MAMFCFVFFPFLSLLLLPPAATGLNADGVLLLSFKYSILSDPFSVLQTWNYDDLSPCSWTGVKCSQLGTSGTLDTLRVSSLVLPNSQLLGSIPPDLGYIEHLQELDLSNNFLNGSVPLSLFVNSTELQVISLGGNEIWGELPDSIGSLKSLQYFNLSDNALAGKLPQDLSEMKKLSVVSLRANYFSGQIPRGFSAIEVLDLSSNLINGSLPADFGGANVRYLNLSYNKLSGFISPKFAAKIPTNATIDLSFNNLTGSIPESVPLMNQKTDSFRGNTELCGKPLEAFCSVPSTLSSPPNVTSIPPAIAVIPQPLDSSLDPLQPNNSNSSQGVSKRSLTPGTIATIVIADLAGVAILGIVIVYVYQFKSKKSVEGTNSVTIQHNGVLTMQEQKKPSKVDSCVVESKADHRKVKSWTCLPIEAEESSSGSSDSDDKNSEQLFPNNTIQTGSLQHQKEESKLVMMDGEELDSETLLKASAFILGSSSGSILYKAVLKDGTAFAVRRIGKGPDEKFNDFKNNVRNLAKLKHPNLVRVRGFYWGDDEKLLVCDFISNGSLSGILSRKTGLSSIHISLETRLSIARSLANGLAFLHDKKQFHGRIRPTNILLTSDMEPVISDFGLSLLSGISKTEERSGSGVELQPDRQISCLTAASSSPYQAPESFKTVKPTSKGDVFSFGVVLLELLTGKLNQWASLSVPVDINHVGKLVHGTIKEEAEANEDSILACFKLGFACVNLVPNKRPSMKDAVHVLEKFPVNSSPIS